MTKLSIKKDKLTIEKEKQLIALGFRPRTIRGWWFWLKYWSPIAWKE